MLYVVVEGKTDAAKLKNIFPNIELIITNGSAISKEKISLIAHIAKDNEVVIFTDPDGPGKKIRQTIVENVPSVKNVFVEKSKAIAGKKVGVAQTKKEDILKAFENIKEFNKENKSITWDQFLELGLNGYSDSKEKRIAICKKLNIEYANAKTLFKWLNMMNKTVGDLDV